MSTEAAGVLEEIEAKGLLEADSRRPSAVRKDRPSWSTTIILILCTATVLVPLYVTISMAFKSQQQAVDGNAFSFPAPFSLEGFTTAWNLTSFPTAFVISVLVSLASVAGTILLASFASFAIARNWDRRPFRWSFYYLLAAMFLPFPVVALPRSS